jgi:Fatty acid hydroxylase superfamily
VAADLGYQDIRAAPIAERLARTLALRGAVGPRCVAVGSRQQPRAPLGSQGAVHVEVPRGPPRRSTPYRTGRFHPFDLAKSVIIGAPIPFLLGVPDEIAWWYAAFNAFTGILTHANIHLQCGIFNEFWSTPNTHRLHHSPDVRETDTNYGEVTMIWDRLLGSYLKPTGVTPRNVGLGADCLVSTRLWDTLIHPLTLRGHRAPVERRIANLEPGQAGLPIAGHE